MYLARKVSRAKWQRRGGLGPDEVPADAVTVDLRTRGNTLSFWRCREANEEALVRVAVALAAARDRLDKVELVWVEADDLVDAGIRLKPSPGAAPMSDMVDAHVDAVLLDLERLGRVARHVARAIRENHRHLWTKAQVRELLVAAVEEGRLELDSLEAKVREDVRTALRKKRGPSLA